MEREEEEQLLVLLGGKQLLRPAGKGAGLNDRQQANAHQASMRQCRICVKLRSALPSHAPQASILRLDGIPPLPVVAATTRQGWGTQRCRVFVGLEIEGD
jgi:hypothetical protein